MNDMYDPSGIFRMLYHMFAFSEIFGILIFFAITFVIYFWIKEFVWLMTLEEKYFSGANDKLVWGAVFIFVFPLAPFAFMLWKRILKQSGKT